MRKMLIFIGILLLIVGCTQELIGQDGDEPEDGMTQQEMQQKAGDVQQQISSQEAEPCDDWKGAELKDVRSGEMFKICDFEGKPVLLESFAVWCPTCKKQQDVIKELHEDVGDEIVSISLDTDPNEDDDQVLAHVNKHGYGWRYVVSPAEVTQALIDDFGFTVVNAPGAPIVLVCPDQSARLLGRGVKSVEELKEEVEKC